MNSLLNAFANFLQESSSIDHDEQMHIADQIKRLLDADPEKLIMRKALEYYANEHNWPYDMHSPDGIGVIGMDGDEATDIARQALKQADESLDELWSEIFSRRETDLHSMSHTSAAIPENKLHH